VLNPMFKKPGSGARFSIYGECLGSGGLEVAAAAKVGAQCSVRGA